MSKSIFILFVPPLIFFLQEVRQACCILRDSEKYVRATLNYLSPVSKIPPVTISNHQNRTPHTTWGENMLVRETKDAEREKEFVGRGNGNIGRGKDDIRVEDENRKRGEQSRKMCCTASKQY